MHTQESSHRLSRKHDHLHNTHTFSSFNKALKKKYSALYSNKTFLM